MDYYDATPVVTRPKPPTPIVADDDYDFSPPLGGFVTLGADPEATANGASGLPMDIALIPRDEVAHSEEITRAPPAPVLEGPEEYGGIPMAEGSVSEVDELRPIVEHQHIEPGQPGSVIHAAGDLGAAVGVATGDLYAKGEIDFGPGINLSGLGAGLGDMFDIGRGSGNNVPFSERGQQGRITSDPTGAAAARRARQQEQAEAARIAREERKAERERIKALEEKTGLPLTTSSRARNILTSPLHWGTDTERNVRKKDWKDWRKEQGHSMLSAITGKRTGSRDSDKEIVRTIATSIFGEKGVENWRNIQQQQRRERTSTSATSTTGGLFDSWPKTGKVNWPRMGSMPSLFGGGSASTTSIAMDLADPGRTDSSTLGPPVTKSLFGTPGDFPVFTSKRRMFGGEKGWTGKEKGAQDQTF